MDAVSAVAGWLADPAHWQGTDGIPNRLVEHLQLSVLAVVLALAVTLPVALYVGHTGRGGSLAVNLAGLGRAVPSYALLIFFFPIFGFGIVAPLLALILLSVPPILANTYVGLRGVDREIVEAGRGMGMTELELLLRVEVPIAMPVILAGIRTAAVASVATATIAALIASGGLGRFIVDGFALQDQPMLISGGILVALLALAVERGLTLLEGRLVSPGLLLAGGPRGIQVDRPDSAPSVPGTSGWM